MANKRLSLETTDRNSACAILRKPAVQPPERPTPAMLQYLGQGCCYTHCILSRELVKAAQTGRPPSMLA